MRLTLDSYYIYAFLKSWRKQKKKKVDESRKMACCLNQVNSWIREINPSINIYLIIKEGIFHLLLPCVLLALHFSPGLRKKF